MIPLSSLAVFFAAALGLLLVPGPAVIYIVTRSVSHGRKAGLASVLGIELASLCHSAAAALGLSAILLASPLVFSLVKYLGAGYLAYLGIRAIFSKEEAPESEDGEAPSLAGLFRRGFVVNLLNPKTALFFYAFLPQFVDPGRGSAVVQILILGAVFVTLATITDGTYALVSSGVGRILLGGAGFRRVQRYVTGSIYLALGVMAAITGSAP